MKKHLFLTGVSGSGKSTLINEVLGERLSSAGGFVTLRQTDDAGKLLGFDILPACAAGGVEGFEPQRILDYTVKPPKAFTEVFRSYGVQLLDEAQYYPFSVIDEFGGFEIIVPQFREKLAEFLSYDQPIIGVIKGAENAEQLRRSLGLGEKYTAFYSRLRAALEGNSQTMIVDLSSMDNDTARSLVSQWADEYC